MNLKYAKLFPAGIIKGINFRIHRARLAGQYPTFLLLAVTERCNCRCAMCNIWKKKDIHDLSLTDYEQLFSDPLWRNLKILSLTGGEPFLRSDLTDIILLAASRIPTLERISLPSNGILTARTVETVREVLAKLPKHIFFKIGISIDGPKEIHDALRGVPGAFDKATRTVRELKKLASSRFDVGILALFTKENALCLSEAHRIFTSLTDKITYTLATESEFFVNREREGEIFTPDTKRRILSFIENTLIPNFPQKAYLYAKYRDHLLKRRRTYPCLAGYRSAFVDTNGNLLPCHYVSTDFAFGNFLRGEESLKAVWFSKKAKEIRRRLSQHPYCKNCSNNCDSLNLVREDFLNLLAYLITHPSIPIKAILKKKAGQ